MPVKTASSEKATNSKKNSKKELKFSKETYVKWYKDMLLIRKFEEKTGQLYIQQKSQEPQAPVVQQINT
jgi:pyruvate dehydrogenase E1 component alpha subunit